MGYVIENRGGQFCVIDSSTGSVAKGTTPSHQISFAEEQVRVLRESAVVVAPTRARNDKGQLKADDPKTPDVNEAWKGGKSPAKKPAAKKKAAPKKKATNK